MALRIKRIKSGKFNISDTDIVSSKTLVDQQLGFETESGNLKINDSGIIKDAVKDILGNAQTATNATNHISDFESHVTVAERETWNSSASDLDELKDVVSTKANTADLQQLMLDVQLLTAIVGDIESLQQQSLELLGDFASES